MPQAGAHTGGCHCGRVRFAVTADLAQVIACNCSICTKRGLLLAFVPPARFTLEAGEDALTDYQFGRKTIHHLFCAGCGVESFARGRKPDGAEMIAVNVRCLDGVDPDSLERMPFDGRQL
ncbi:aldehyde-activating protein [Siccirubricoccus deserti]|uniref:GFA family protein n=1 Tax=Siccirubricoccus deserti TaxID=2013562 RepID=UPI0019A974B2|nr:GFA family protein [Siccirubricoccus deserti]GGC45074.1 aldehyde-activating protein [Siccirubricoccus deserti]